MRKTRGSPDVGRLVHMIDEADMKDKLRRGLRTFDGNWTDSNTNVMCGSGSWHIEMTDDPKQVTCPECLRRMSNGLVMESRERGDSSSEG